jgi:excisionase family DNA binding protein
VDDLLTTRQLQDLLQVDRITIYRMLNDGRLRGFKVGGQWRFSHREIEAWLQEQQRDLEGASPPPPPDASIAPSPQVLPLSCVQAIQGICAEALDIATVTVDLDGDPLTGVSNSCDFCNLILATDKGRRRCAASWKLVDDGQVHPCHAGLLCVSAPIVVRGQQVSIAAACQFVTQPLNGAGLARQNTLAALATELGLIEGELQAAAASVRLVPEGYLRRVSSLLLRMADTFSEIGQERLNLLSRLQDIAEMSKI